MGCDWERGIHFWKDLNEGAIRNLRGLASFGAERSESARSSAQHRPAKQGPQWMTYSCPFILTLPDFSAAIIPCSRSQPLLVSSLAFARALPPSKELTSTVSNCTKQ